MGKEKKWLEVAEKIGSCFSTCSKRQYGAIIIAKNGRIIGVGYNGSAPNSVHCNAGGCPRAIENSPNGSVYDNCIAIHAEANAIIWSDQAMRQGSTLVINGPPCYGCAKLIATSGISEVICYEDLAYLDFKKVAEYFESVNIKLKVYRKENNG